jgi:hypothetical protein
MWTQVLARTDELNSLQTKTKQKQKEAKIEMKN